MPLIVNRPTNIDVTRSNPRGRIYIDTSSATTQEDENAPDGSLRVVPDVDGVNVALKRKASGVWNATGLALSGASIELGDELTMSAAGEFIETYDAGDDTKQLHPHIHYSSAGTLETGYFPNLSSEYDDVVQAIDTDQIVFSDKSISYLITNQSLQLLANFKVGSTVPTGNVIIEAYRDKPLLDSLYYEETIPQSVFDVADGTEIQIIYTSKLQANEGETVVLRLYTDDGLDMSLRGDSTSGDWYLSNRQQDMIEDPIMTASMLDKISVGLDCQITIDNSGNIVYGNMTF